MLLSFINNELLVVIGETMSFLFADQQLLVL
jgi:hypothetical protein